MCAPRRRPSEKGERAAAGGREKSVIDRSGTGARLDELVAHAERGGEAGGAVFAGCFPGCRQAGELRRRRAARFHRWNRVEPRSPVVPQSFQVRAPDGKNGRSPGFLAGGPIGSPEEPVRRARSPAALLNRRAPSSGPELNAHRLVSLLPPRAVAPSTPPVPRAARARPAPGCNRGARSVVRRRTDIGLGSCSSTRACATSRSVGS